MSGRRIWAACGLLLLALGLRVGYATHAWRSGYVVAHNDEYETVARNLVRHHAYNGILDDPRPTAAREPGYPFFIAAIYEAAGERPYAVLLVQCLLGALTCGLMALLARRLSGERAGWLTLAVCAGYPFFVYYCANFFRETLLCFLLSGFLLALGRLFDRPSAPRAAAAAGFLYGLCAVTFSTFMALGAVLCGLILLMLWRRRAGAGSLAAFALGAALLPVAWVGRDYAVFHRLIPGSTIGGFNLYTTLILPADDRGTDREPVVLYGDPTWAKIQAMLPDGPMTDDGRQSDAFMAAAKERIKADPAAYAAHVARYMAKLWRLYPYHRQYVHSFALLVLASLLSDGWLVPLGLWALWVFRKRDPLVPFMAAIVLSGTLVYSMLSPCVLRYRLPFMVALIPLACGWLAETFPGRSRA